MSTNEMGLGPLAVRQTRTRDALDALRNAIVTGRLAPGSLHSVAELATEFGVSRTPVREALIELASAGMVEFERNRGFRILQRSTHDLREVFELRLLLEVPATRRAVQRLDDDTLRRLEDIMSQMSAATEAGNEEEVFDCDREFHHTLLSVAGNTRLIAIIYRLRDQVRLHGASTVGRTRTLASVLAEHAMIYEPVAARDAEAAARAMRRHLLNTAELLIAQEGGQLGDIMGSTGMDQDAPGLGAMGVRLA